MTVVTVFFLATYPKCVTVVSKRRLKITGHSHGHGHGLFIYCTAFKFMALVPDTLIHTWTWILFWINYSSSFGTMGCRHSHGHGHGHSCDHFCRHLHGHGHGCDNFCRRSHGHGCDHACRHSHGHGHGCDHFCLCRLMSHSWTDVCKLDETMCDLCEVERYKKD